MSYYLETYWNYLQRACLDTERSHPSVDRAIEQTQWDDPETPLDWNNSGVLALIEAELAEDLDTRRLYFEMAIAALSSAVENHPLNMAHLALAYSLIGETANASQLALSAFIQTLQPAYTQRDAPPGLIYLPLSSGSAAKEGGDRLLQLVQAPTSFQQALLLLAEVLAHQLLPTFYNDSGLRLMTLATQVLPQTALDQLLLGVAHCIHGDWQGLLHLHQSQQLAPDRPTTLQALSLAYRDFGDSESANFWLNTARQPTSPTATWTTLELSNSLTYLAFDQDITLAVRASLLNISTGVLLATGDWFEAEMEFWRDRLQPGMTVLDVGANVGVYTFSAATRVGPTGRVLAIEPFSECIQCLQTTVQLNQLDWVTVVAGAASDQVGKAKLALQAASELNEIIAENEAISSHFEVVNCLTLDSLIESENLSQVDYLKIDAEGHEMQVLQGGQHLMQRFKPVILYENIAGLKGGNRSTAEFLLSQGYQLFRYQPYLKQLIPIDVDQDLETNLNLIALPL